MKASIWQPDTAKEATVTAANCAAADRPNTVAAAIWAGVCARRLRGYDNAGRGHTLLADASHAKREGRKTHAPRVYRLRSQHNHAKVVVRLVMRLLQRVVARAAR
jgi:hypothetical protein